MNIAFDIDDTCSKYPEFFMELGRAWRARGHKVYLITGLGDKGLEERRAKFPFLNKLDWYDDLPYTTRFYNEEEKALIGKVPNGEIVAKFKHRMCNQLKVVVLFDDMASLFREFGTTPIFEVK